MQKIWFVLNENLVSGPLTTTEVQEQFARSPSEALIWWRGQTHWCKLTDWITRAGEIENSLIDRGGVHQRYYLHAGKDTEGPYLVAEIAERIQGVQIDRVQLWSEKRQRWGSIFEFPTVCEAVGVTRREHPRVPLAGTVTISKDNIEASAEIVSVSLGGLGLRLTRPVAISGVVHITLRSPDLFHVLKTKGEVMYLRPDGRLGLKFINLSVENQSAIVQYVRGVEAAHLAAA